MLVVLLVPFFCAFSAYGSFPKPLAKIEEQHYLIQMKEGTKEEKSFAKQKLILHNLRLVAHIAKKFNSTPQEQEELISIGVIGLIKAIHSYNTEKSIRLATYASRCIENEILMSLRCMKKYQNDISLYEPIGTDRDGNEIVMLDVINSNDPDFAEEMFFFQNKQKMLKAVKECLTDRERYVVIKRYGLLHQDVLTQQEIASELGISRSYVSRIEKKALKKLNAAMKG